MKISNKKAQTILSNNPPKVWSYVQNGQQYKLIAIGNLIMKAVSKKITLKDVMNEILKIHAILNEHTGILKEHGEILKEHGEILKEHSEVLKQHSKILNEHDKLFKEHGWK